LMNNMFDTNIPYDQQGPVAFHWSLRSHAGGWKAGGASQFGHGVLQPLVAWRADGKNAGAWPGTGSFMSVDAPNVMCSVIKPAEMNGRGLILRLAESIGETANARVSLPFLPNLESVVETSLVEADRAGQIKIEDGHSFVVPFRPFGVKTLRITCAGEPAAVSNVTAQALADMRVDLQWKCD
jgi:alpha-mannosidase